MEALDKDKNLRIVSLNVDGLERKFIDVQHYMLKERVDIALIQEARVDESYKPRIGGYKMYTLSKNDGIHGLVTFIKESIAVTEFSLNFSQGIECQAFKVTFKGNHFNLVNVYFSANSFKTTLLPDELFRNESLLIGDFNARNPLLGSEGVVTNPNGKALYNFINDNSFAKLVGSSEPTHARGGRIDYVCMFGDFCSVKSFVSDELYSDHFALVIDCFFDTYDIKLGRSRLNFDKRKSKEILKDLNIWFKKLLEGDKIKDVDEFNGSIVDEIHKIFGEGGKFEPKRRTKIGELKRWYNDDPVLKRLGKAMRRLVKIVKRDRNNDENVKIMKNLQSRYREAKLKSRNDYWMKFVNEINGNTSSGDVWRKISIARGKRKKETVVHEPQKEVERLSEIWAKNSSFESLPDKIKKCLEDLKDWRKRIYEEKMDEESEMDVDFNEFELENALKRGKSTAPGKDAITYDIIGLLAQVEGNPLLKLFNLIWSKGKIPKKWKLFLMIPIPRASDPDRPRPISLGSCLSKTFERLVLNRIMYVLKDKFSSNMFGFLPGRGTGEALAAYHSFQNCRYSVFLDLKSAFDRANIDVILYNLSKYVTGKTLKVVKHFLMPRDIQVFCQGKLSCEKSLDLGTPQGGVLSPTLFNVLMMPLAEIKLPPDCQLVVYADDVLLQSKSHLGMKIMLKKVCKMCLLLGLEISEEKTKGLYDGRGLYSRLNIYGKELEFVNSYKYLGTIVGKTAARTLEIERIMNICRERIRPMRALALGENGVNSCVLRRMYIGFIRPIIDYSASALMTLGICRIRKLERVQNEALRCILGVPKTCKVECLRKECGIESIEFRIKEITLNVCVRILSDERDHPLKEKIIRNNPNMYNKWVRELVSDLKEIGLCSRIFSGPNFGKPLKPWLRRCIDVRILKTRKKRHMICEEEKGKFLEFIEKSTKDIDTEKVYFTDGSLSPNGKSGSALVNLEENLETGVRLGNDASSTQSEIFALLLALKEIKRSGKNGIICCDSQGALKSINSKNVKCRLHVKLINRLHIMVNSLLERGIQVIFIWVPSHIGLLGNEVADKKAKEACEKEIPDYDFGLSREQ